MSSTWLWLKLLKQEQYWKSEWECSTGLDPTSSSSDQAKTSSSLGSNGHLEQLNQKEEKKKLFKKVVNLESQNVSALQVKKIQAGSKVQ